MLWPSSRFLLSFINLWLVLLTGMSFHMGHLVCSTDSNSSSRLFKLKNSSEVVLLHIVCVETTPSEITGEEF